MDCIRKPRKKEKKRKRRTNDFGIIPVRTLPKKWRRHIEAYALHIRTRKYKNSSKDKIC